MKKRLFIANTFSQFIIACQISLTLFKDDIIDMVLTDQTEGLSSVYANLKGTKRVFNSIYLYRTKDYCDKHVFFGYANDIVKCVFTKGLYTYFANSYYDELIYFNLDYALLSMVDNLSKKNRNIIVSRYEEGVLSYNHEFDYSRLNIIRKLRKICGRTDPDDYQGFFYCFFPQLYRGKLEPVKIPPVTRNDNKLYSTIKKCFDIKIDENCYARKYIFFSSVYDFEGETSIGEYDAVCKIADLVGKDNILIKMHPRDRRTIYTDNGFMVDSNSAFPWEAIQFNVDIQNKILLTVNSSSVLSTTLMFGNMVRSYYVYKLCDVSHNSYAKESISTIENVLFNDDLKKNLSSVKILEQIDELI